MKQYIELFIKVCKYVFKEFVGLELEAKTPYYMEKEALFECDISSIIGITGEARGAVIISMKVDLATKLTSILTGAEYTGLDDDVVDAMGEIVNIVAGNVNRELEKTFKLMISMPTIIKGNGHSINWPLGQAKVICIPFTACDTYNFTLSVALEEV